ncbi:MAG: hypothetical protein ABI361_05260 [Nitrososphaera sp.]|jgi:hypothetical protein
MMGKKGLATKTIDMTLSAIRKFYTENRAESMLNWKWLKSRIPQNQGRVRDKGYTQERSETFLRGLSGRQID